MGIGSEKATPPRFINFVGSFREPGSNATLTGWMLVAGWGPPAGSFFFSQRARRARSITVGPTGREQATNGGRGGRVEACELRSEVRCVSWPVLHCALQADYIHDCGTCTSTGND